MGKYLLLFSAYTKLVLPVPVEMLLLPLDWCSGLETGCWVFLPLLKSNVRSSLVYDFWFSKFGKPWIGIPWCLVLIRPSYVKSWRDEEFRGEKKPCDAVEDGEFRRGDGLAISCGLEMRRGELTFLIYSFSLSTKFCRLEYVYALVRFGGPASLLTALFDVLSFIYFA